MAPVARTGGTQRYVASDAGRGHENAERRRPDIAVPTIDADFSWIESTAARNVVRQSRGFGQFLPGYTVVFAVI